MPTTKGIRIRALHIEELRHYIPGNIIETWEDIRGDKIDENLWVNTAQSRYSDSNTASYNILADNTWRVGFPNEHRIRLFAEFHYTRANGNGTSQWQVSGEEESRYLNYSSSLLGVGSSGGTICWGESNFNFSQDFDTNATYLGCSKNTVLKTNGVNFSCSGSAGTVAYVEEGYEEAINNLILNTPPKGKLEIKVYYNKTRPNGWYGQQVYVSYYKQSGYDSINFGIPLTDEHNLYNDVKTIHGSYFGEITEEEFRKDWKIVRIGVYIYGVVQNVRIYDEGAKAWSENAYMNLNCGLDTLKIINFPSLDWTE
jgi:hypothetical protein